MKTRRTLSLLLSATSLVFLACNDDSGTDEANTTETGDGDGDMGDGDGDEGMTTSGDGDGDGDGDMGDGDGDGDGDGGDGDGDGDMGDGDGDGDAGDGDGDGDGGDGDGDGDGDGGDGDGDGGGFCGDGMVNGNEVCDDGINDGSYDGCGQDCLGFGPYCGDGDFHELEACDDGNDNSADGCLAGCVIPRSCLEIHDFDDALPNGIYRVAPEGYVGDPFEVYCDMVTDGGGYTFLKIAENQQRFAADAESTCDSWGMNLWIPRSEAHKNSGWAIANNAQIGPGANAHYMRILGIYPNFNGATCLNQGMNSANQNCQWDASDDGPWFVHNVNNISEPNGDNSTIGSMFYDWQNNGNILDHNDIPGPGYSSLYYMCDVGDKLP